MAEHDIFYNNSDKAKSGRLEAEPEKVPERAHAKPVTRLVNEQKKPGLGRKFKKLFLADDVDDIGGYLRDDLIIPTLKDVALNFLEAALWGTRRSGGLSRDSGRRTRSGYTNYSQSSSVARVSRGSTRNREEESRASAKKFDILDNLLFRTKAEAEDILMRMEDYLDTYDSGVPIGYLYELLDISGDWTAEYYGWKDLRRARTTRVSNGYVLELPDPIELSRR